MQAEEKSIEPVTVHDDSVEFRPKEMEIGKYYLVVLKGKPYIYRKINNHEVEVYGMVEQT